MKKQILSLILFLLIYIYIVTCTACSNRSPSTDHIEALFKEYGIRKYNYLWGTKRNVYIGGEPKTSEWTMDKAFGAVLLKKAS